jgi:hypothetical protein
LTSETETRTVLSGDGKYWWNGERWLPAVTEDGLWRWDGTAWTPTTDLAGRQPQELAAVLAGLADERFEEAGAILSRRSSEWRTDGEAREVLQQLQTAERRARGVKRLQRAQRWLDPLGRTGASGQAGQADAVEEDVWTRQLRIRLGRRAPRPSLREADDILVAARSLDERATSLATAAAELEEAERRRAEAIERAREAVAAADEPRQQAIRQAKREILEAEAAHARACAQARANLRRLHKPGRGELRAELNGIRLYANLIQTPEGRLPVAGAGAYLDTAGVLWHEQHDVLSALVLLQVPGVEPFLDELVDRGDALFLLLVSRTGSFLEPCAPEEEEATRAFVGEVRRAAQEAARAELARADQARQAELQIEALTADRSAVAQVQARLARIESDPELLRPVEAAQWELAQASADTPELARARGWVGELHRRFTAPPQPLRPATDL